MIFLVGGYVGNNAKNQRGMALVAVILISAFILLTIVAIASMASYGGRLGTRNERLGYQALLTAESGLNTFNTRVSLLSPGQRFYGTLSAANINTWLVNNGLSTLTLGNQGTATLSAVGVNASTVTLQSSSALSGLAGHKKVLVDVSAFRALRSPRVLAALTSYVPISFNGNSSSGGLDGLTSLGTYDLTTSTSSVTIPASPKIKPFDLEVVSAALIGAESYVEVDGYTYKVLGKQDNTLNLRPVVALSSSRTITSSSNVALILSATTQRVTTNTFTVSDVGQFGLHDKLFIDSYEAQITNIDPVLGKLTVSWIGFGPNNSSPILEGTPIRRYIYGALSAGNIGVQGSSTVEPAMSPDDTLRLPSKTSMFEQTFGIPEAQFLQMPGLTTLTTTPDVVSGLTYVNGNWSSKSICGKGIVVINGNATINGVCPTGFQGLLYVQGDFDMAGNSTLQGAVVVEGNTETKVRGTGAPIKIEYDPKVLLEVGSSFSPWNFEAVTGSWRLK